MTDAAETDRLRAQVAALIADRKALDDTIAFLINVTSASVQAIREAIPIIADVNPDVAAQASQIVTTWTEFIAGAELAKAAAAMQNAPSSDVRQ